jgi:hypothetical protein
MADDRPCAAFIRQTWTVSQRCLEQVDAANVGECNGEASGCCRRLARSGSFPHQGYSAGDASRLCLQSCRCSFAALEHTGEDG